MSKILFERNVNKWGIDAFNSIVIKEDDGTIRKARTLGGYVSRSGMTENPWLIEKGSIRALRIDAWINRLRELGFGRFVTTCIVFTGHGTKFVTIQEIDEEEAVRCFRDWKAFRIEGNKIPKKEDYSNIELVFKTIRQLSKGLFNEFFYLTYDEILGMDSEMEIEFDESNCVISVNSERFYSAKDSKGWLCFRKVFERQELEVGDEFVDM